MNSGRDLLNTLPSDMLEAGLYPEFSSKNINDFVCTSKRFSLFFEDSRKKELLRMGFSSEVLRKLEKLRAERKVSFTYKQVYLKLQRLMEKAKLQENRRRLRFWLEDEDDQFLVLAVCSNHGSFWDWVAWDQKVRALLFAKYAQAEELIKTVLQDPWRKEMQFDEHFFRGMSDSFIEWASLEKDEKGEPILSEEMREKIKYKEEEPAWQTSLKSLFGESKPQQLSDLERERLTAGSGDLRARLGWSAQNLLQDKFIQGNLEEAKEIISWARMHKLDFIYNEVFFSNKPFLPVGESLLVRMAGDGYADIVEYLLSQKDSEGRHISLTGDHVLVASINSGCIYLVKRLLSLRDEQGNPVFAFNENLLDWSRSKGAGRVHCLLLLKKLIDQVKQGQSENIDDILRESIKASFYYTLVVLVDKLQNEKALNTNLTCLGNIKSFLEDVVNELSSQSETSWLLSEIEKEKLQEALSLIDFRLKTAETFSAAVSPRM